MEKKQIRYMTLTLSAPNGTAINTYTEDFLRLDPAYNKITGISIMEVSNGGIPNNYRAGIKDSRGVKVDPVNIQNWIAGSGVSPDDKYLSMDLSYNDGDRIYANMTNLAALTAALTIDVTFRLEADLTEQPKL